MSAARALRWATGSVLLGSGQAWAAPVTTTFCFDYEIDFTDKGVGDLLTGSTVKAYGARVKIIDESGPTTVYDGFTSDITACVVLDGAAGTVQLDTSKSYTVQLPREAEIDGNSIVVQNAAGGSLTAQVKSGLVPVANTTYSDANGYLWASVAGGDRTSLIAASSYALWRRPAGSSGESFVIRDAGCGGSGSQSCYDESTEILWVADPDRRFVIGHVMGLAIAHFENYHQDIAHDGNADVDDCIAGWPVAGHEVNTREYSSNAVLHGIGRFYSAAAFNDDGTDADCEYQVTYFVNWNADGDRSDTDEDETFSCSASPAAGVNDYAYFDQFCTTGDINNRTTAYDWLKFWWDWRTDSSHGGATVDEAFDLWSDADPHDWVTNGDLGGGSVDYPWFRLCEAADGGSCDAFGDFNDLSTGVHGVGH